MSLASGCSDSGAAPDTYNATGELIALSGGDGGPQGACATCHGLNGEGDGNLVPRLAGLDAGYIARQLVYYDEGQRRHEQMSWIAGHLDWDAREKVSNYYAAMPVPVPEVAGGSEALSPATCSPAIESLYLSGDPARGIRSCASCHGVDGRGIGAGNPPLADQPAPYLADQLRRWRSGERYGDPGDVMIAVSSRLREEELRPLSDYSAHLTGGRTRPALREACR